MSTEKHSRDVAERHATPEESTPNPEIDRLLAYAKARRDQGYLSDEEYNAVLASCRALESPASIDADKRALQELTEHMKWDDAFEATQRSLRGRLRKLANREVVDDTEAAARAFDVALRQHLIHSVQLNPDARPRMDLWREFSSRLHALSASQEPRNLKKIEDALAVALHHLKQ